MERVGFGPQAKPTGRIPTYDTLRLGPCRTVGDRLAQFGGQEFEDNSKIVTFANQNGPKSLFLFQRGEINGDGAFLT
jgi:hypothetical protein